MMDVLFWFTGVVFALLMLRAALLAFCPGWRATAWIATCTQPAAD